MDIGVGLVQRTRPAAASGAAERDAVTAVARRIQDATGLELPSVGVGSTPSASNPPDHLDGVTEMHRESSNGLPHLTGRLTQTVAANRDIRSAGDFPTNLKVMKGNLAMLCESNTIVQPC